jgi:hypothetical protein
MKKIGIYYHPSFSRKSYMTIGNRLRDFPEALEPLLARPNVRLIEAPRASQDLILKVHAPEMLAMVAQDGFCSTAYESVGSVVAGMVDLARGEIDRAFCFHRRRRTTPATASSGAPACSTTWSSP